MFNLLKIPVEIVYDDADLALQKVRSGEIAAAARSGIPPLGGFEKIKPEDKLHFIPINEETLPGIDFNNVRTAYLPYRMRSAQYPALIPDGGEVPTIAGNVVLAVYAWPADTKRYQNLVKFVQLFFDNIDQFQKAPRHPGWQEVNFAANVAGWNRFPAAQQWLERKRKTASVPSLEASTDPKLKKAFERFLMDLSKEGRGSFDEQQRAQLFDQFQVWWNARSVGSR